MGVFASQVVTVRFYTPLNGGTVAAPDATPTVRLNVNGESVSTPTITLMTTGDYKVAATIPSNIAIGDVVQITVLAVMGGNTQKAVVFTGICDSVAEGVGGVAVNHDTGGTDNYRILSSGSPVSGATISAYVKSEFDATPTTAVRRGQTVTGDDGRWAAALMLDSGTEYTIVVEAAGEQTYQFNVTP